MLLKAAVFVVFLKLILWDLFLRCSSIDERLSITHDEFANSNELKFLAQNRLDLIGYEDKYINFSRLDDPLLIEHTKRILDKSCGEYVDVIIFMISSPDNTHLRESHRNVIGNQRIKSESRTLKNKYRHCFVYTVGYSGKEYLDEYVDTESLRFSDIIRIPLVESYYNLPKKVSTSLAVLNHFKDRFEYVLKTDDDTVIKTNILIPMIFSEFRKFDIVGYVKEAPCVIRHENDKFYMSKDDMSSDHFHSHPQGGGYIIRSSVVKGIINQFNYSTYYKFEDVMMGQIVIDLDLKLGSNIRMKVCIHEDWDKCHGFDIILMDAHITRREEKMRRYQIDFD